MSDQNEIWNVFLDIDDTLVLTSAIKATSRFSASGPQSTSHSQRPGLPPGTAEFLDKFKVETSEPSSGARSRLPLPMGSPRETEKDIADQVVALLQGHRVVKKKEFDSLVSEVRKKLFPPNRKSSKEKKSEEPGLFSRD